MLDKRLDEIAVRWNKVEERLKEVESVSRMARIPAINELRYAGRQIVDALAKLQRDETDISRNVTAAMQYVQNADHDLTDAILDYFHTRLDTAYAKYGEAAVIRHFPDAPRMRARIEAAEAINKQSRGTREKRDELYEKVYKEYVLELIELYRLYRSVEPKFAYDQRLLQMKYSVSYYINVFLGICTFLGLVYSVMSYHGWTWSGIFGSISPS